MTSEMVTDVAAAGDELIAAAARAADTLRELAPRNEQARELVPESLEAIAAHGLGRMSLPRHRGGGEVPYAVQERVLQEFARGCPSSAWVATVYTASIAMAGYFPDHVQDRLLDGPAPRISGVVAPTARAMPASGGWEISGRWTFNSGCRGADWGLMSAMGPEGPLLAAISYDKLHIQDDWHTMGLRGTGSSSVVADGVFVPADWALPLGALLEGVSLSERNRSVPMLNIPLIPLLMAAAGGTPVGMARGAMELFLERLPSRSIATTFYDKQAEAPVTHLMLGEAAMKVDLAAYLSGRAAGLADRLGGRPWSTSERVQLRADVGYATKLAKEVVDELLNASGASAVYDDSPMQRYVRDIRVLAQHAGLQRTTNVEMHGRVLAGLEPHGQH